MAPFRHLALPACGLLLLAAAALPATPAADVVTPEMIAELKAEIAKAKMAGDNAWLMTSAALVLMMTAPGLMLFYGGLVRAKNILSVLMQGFFLMALVSIVWLVYGYSLAFSPGSPFLGGLDHLFLKGVEGMAGAIPHQTFMFFQLMFAIITPCLIVGAFAERFRFPALVAFMFLWVTVIYVPLAHMVWGPGGLLNAFAAADSGGGQIKALDFAGGTVVHISSGVSALVCSLYLGRRFSYPSGEFVPHSLVLSATGAGLLWVGWFGFNAGSALEANALAASAFTATHMSAAGATFSWLLAEWVFRGKPSLLGAISGAVAGLVVVTPGAGFVSPVSGLIMGLIGGVVCWFAVTKVKSIFKYDDSLDVFGVHGVGGMLGAVLTGVFATKSVNDCFGGNPVGLVDGNAGQVVNQLLATAITVVLALVGTVVILFVVDKLIGAKASDEDQVMGLDIVDHGESGYHMA